MPNKDGTGPLGRGPLTGRGFGPCGCGMRRGFGRGFAKFGFGCRVITEKEEKEALKEELKYLDEEKKEIEARLKEL